ncbi:MAG: FMN-binding protein [Moraxellaceae bacterium]
MLSDAVIGKHELFDYAVAFDRQGRSASAPLRVGQGIDNISGATLSCKHLTDGIRRLAFYVRRHLLRESNT